MERTLIQARRLDIFFRVRAAGGYESTDTAGKGARSFIQLIRAEERVRRFTDLGGFRDVGVFYKIFNFVGSMRSARFRQRKSGRKSNRS